METGAGERVQSSIQPARVNTQPTYATKEGTRSVGDFAIASRHVLTFLSHLAFAFAQLLHAIGVLPLFSILLCEE